VTSTINFNIVVNHQTAYSWSASNIKKSKEDDKKDKE
jgi:hypothetical protein